MYSDTVSEDLPVLELLNIQINRYILTTMQERFVPQITEIEPGRLEKRRVSYAQKLRLMYLVNPAVAAILAAGITAAMLGIGHKEKAYAADFVTPPKIEVQYAGGQK